VTNGGLFSLAGRVALVTGAGSETGIGFASARLLASLGAAVAITSTTDRIHARRDELSAAGGNITSHIADLTEEQQVASLVEGVDEAHGRIDVLVHAAGMIQTGREAEYQPVTETELDEWQRDLAINLTSGFLIAREVLPRMVQARYGRIIFLSSVTGPLVVAPDAIGYAAGKAGLDGLMRGIALEMGPSGITANSVAPGWIATGSSTEAEREAGLHTPVGRPGTPDEVAAAVAFLATEASAYVTGHSLVVDGGNTIQEIHGPGPGAT
jgi:3-oxoacyl-[acyl-carrier protein] reductase